MCLRVSKLHIGLLEEFALLILKLESTLNRMTENVSSIKMDDNGLSVGGLVIHCGLLYLHK